MNNLRKVLAEKGMTTVELSKKSGISIRTIESYFGENRNIDNARVSIVVKIAHALDMSVEELLSFTDR